MVPSHQVSLRFPFALVRNQLDRPPEMFGVVFLRLIEPLVPVDRSGVMGICESDFPINLEVLII